LLQNELSRYCIDLRVHLQSKTTSVMKVILTFVAVIFFTTTAFTQSTLEEVKVETTAASVELNVEIEMTEEIKTETEVARLYMFKNSRIKKALAFRTKRNKSKLA